MANTPPALGYGNTSAASIDSVNQWMRTQPWYQALLKSFGQYPNNVHLNDAQKTAVVRAAQANGVIVDEGGDGQEVDDSGNFAAKGHGLRNTLIVAGIAAAGIATLGAAGVLGGAALAGEGAGAAAGAGAAEGGVLASTALPATGALATGAASSLGAGATAGVGAGAAGAAFDAAGNFIGPSTVSGAGGATYGAAAGASGSGIGGDLLKYGLPIAGGIANSLIQANASGNASAAQQKYLEEALAYEKSKDAYSRDLEASRYATYSSNIAPYVATGATANTKMASLLGLPPTTTAAPSVAPAPTFGTPGMASTPPTPTQPVTMRAPDGSTRQVAAGDVARATAAGAQIVSA